MTLYVRKVKFDCVHVENFYALFEFEYDDDDDMCKLF